MEAAPDFGGPASLLRQSHQWSILPGWSDWWHSISARMVLGWVGEIPLSRVFALCRLQIIFMESFAATPRSPRANLGLFSNFPSKNWDVFQVEQGLFPRNMG